MSTPLAPAAAEDDGRFARVADRVEQGTLVLDRVIDLPAGRIQPASYARFQAFARKVDAALHRDVSVTLGR